MNNQAEEARRLIQTLRDDLKATLLDAARSADYDAAKERLSRWKSRAVELIGKHVSPGEARALDRKRVAALLLADPMGTIRQSGKLYDSFLEGLEEQLRLYPSQVLRPAFSAEAPMETPKPPETTATPAIFLIHGRDELNLLRLRDLLRDKWGLGTIIMSGQPGKGRTLIEKFEQEAQPAALAMALLTPDDIVSTTGGQYAQARPNVVFELGWFYGRLGRANVCILFKKGTHLHSDLDGISRIEFNESIAEKALEIEAELLAASILPKSSSSGA